MNLKKWIISYLLIILSPYLAYMIASFAIKIELLILSRSVFFETHSVLLYGIGIILLVCTNILVNEMKNN